MSDQPNTTGTMPEPFRDVIRIDEGQLHKHLDEVVRDSVEQTLNALLDAEADRLDTRAGSYSRTLHTKAGEVELQVPRLRKLPFESQIIERYRRRESSVEEALIEMYLAGVSVRRIEDITEALWGTKVGPSAVSEKPMPAPARYRVGRYAGQARGDPGIAGGGPSAARPLPTSGVHGEVGSP
jgi:hypothetical protein